MACAPGCTCEWCDFFLYAMLAPFFAGLFYPRGNQAAAFVALFMLATTSHFGSLFAGHYYPVAVAVHAGRAASACRKAAVE